VNSGIDVIDISDDALSAEAAEAGSGSAEFAGFSVTLDEFAGPFDLLLSLISKHKLEVTELALHQVTDDFCSYIRNQGSDWDLEEATSFLVVAATLLDLKAARLLPSGEVEDEEDLALLEARDLLFARLLQYKAFKEVAAIFDEKILAQAHRIPRSAGLDPEYAELLPDVVLSLGLERFAWLAAGALAPKPVIAVGIDHIHQSTVSVAEQGLIVAARVQREGTATFRSLVADADATAVIIARFLSLLELFRQGKIALDQVASLGDLHVRWIGSPQDSPVIDLTSEFDGESQLSEAIDQSSDETEAEE
jgi:segregation and condensation protein A